MAQNSRITASTSMGMSLYACIRAWKCCESLCFHRGKYVRLHSVSTAAYSWWSSAYVVSFLTEEMGSSDLFGNCQWTSTIIRTTKKQCIKILKECCGSNFSFPLSATNRAGWSIGPICHHRHLIHDTFKRQIPDDFTNHYTDNEPAVLQELPVKLLHPL